MILRLCIQISDPFIKIINKLLYRGFAQPGWGSTATCILLMRPVVAMLLHHNNDRFYRLQFKEIFGDFITWRYVDNGKLKM